jgi:putative ABC transport system permease protein
MNIDEVNAIIEHAPSVAKITPVRFGSYDVKHGQILKTNVQVQGIWPSWHEIENRYVIFGRTFNKIDEDECRQVCIVNEQAIRELDLDRDPTGDFIIINGRRFLIVGVVETKDQGAMFGGGDTRSEIYIPLSMSAKMNPEGWINYCLAEMAAPDRSEEAKAEVTFIMRKVRKLEPGYPDTFDIGVVQQVIDQFNKLAAGMTAIAGGVVGISLLVGGIGIMNIMLVSVSERTREIGLRKAVGAKPSIILLQFLVEAVVLCVVGGLIGLVIGQALAILCQSIPDFPLNKAEIPPWAIALSFIFSAAVGVIFGMFPAIKASRLDPIEALRHE